MPPKTAKVTAAGAGRVKLPDKLTDSEKKKVQSGVIIFLLEMRYAAHIRMLPRFRKRGCSAHALHPISTFDS